MDLAVALPLDKIDAANRLHDRLEQWKLADQALRLLAERCADFEPATCLLKVAAVNELYGTNVYATTRMAKHVARLLVGANLATAGPELVERLAALPAADGQKGKRRHLSFASKFAHFFLRAFGNNEKPDSESKASKPGYFIEAAEVTLPNSP